MSVVGVFCGSDFSKEAFTFWLKRRVESTKDSWNKSSLLRFACHWTTHSRATRGGLLLCSLEKWLYHGIIAQVSRPFCPLNKFCMCWGTKLVRLRRCGNFCFYYSLLILLVASPGAWLLFLSWPMHASQWEASREAKVRMKSSKQVVTKPTRLNMWPQYTWENIAENEEKAIENTVLQLPNETTTIVRKDKTGWFRIGYFLKL